MNNRSGYYDNTGCLLHRITRCFDNTKEKIQLFNAYVGPFNQKAVSIVTISYLMLVTVNFVLLINEGGTFLAVCAHFIVLKINIT